MWLGMPLAIRSEKAATNDPIKVHMPTRISRIQRGIPARAKRWSSRFASTHRASACRRSVKEYPARRARLVWLKWKPSKVRSGTLVNRTGLISNVQSGTGTSRTKKVETTAIAPMMDHTMSSGRRGLRVCNHALTGAGKSKRETASASRASARSLALAKREAGSRRRQRSIASASILGTPGVSINTGRGAWVCWAIIAAADGPSKGTRPVRA